MNREIEFDEEEYCDDCGVKGAFDFMGDYYCHECLRKHRHEQRITRHEQKTKEKSDKKQRS